MSAVYSFRLLLLEICVDLQHKRLHDELELLLLSQRVSDEGIFALLLQFKSLHGHLIRLDEYAALRPRVPESTQVASEQLPQLGAERCIRFCIRFRNIVLLCEAAAPELGHDCVTLPHVRVKLELAAEEVIEYRHLRQMCVKVLLSTFEAWI